MKRKALSKAKRFEVFKRDSFTCQYCGRSAPDVILECDHIIPVAEGGTNDILNLITSCKDCNRGKGKRKLTDNQTIEKQKQQLDDLNALREQTEMMIDWKRELMVLADTQIDFVEETIFSLSNTQDSKSLTDHGRRGIRKLIERFGFDEVCTAANIAVSYYYDGTDSSLEKAITKIGGICYNRKYRNDEYDE